MIIAKAIFTDAVEWNLIPSNPFAKLVAGSQANPERWHYVPRDEIAMVLDACPGDEWRAIVGLARFAGLRCPSELVGLTWAGLDFEKRMLTVRSPKKRRLGDQAMRFVPIEPQLMAILQRLFDAAPVGAGLMLPGVRTSERNMRTGFLRILARAKVMPWPRLFQNMRASFEMDLVDTEMFNLPDHAAAQFMGHSPNMARKHYLRARDSHAAAVTRVEPHLKSRLVRTSDTTFRPVPAVSANLQEVPQVPGGCTFTASAASGCNPVEQARWARRDSNPRRR